MKSSVVAFTCWMFILHCRAQDFTFRVSNKFVALKDDNDDGNDQDTLNGITTRVTNKFVTINDDIEENTHDEQKHMWTPEQNTPSQDLIYSPTDKPDQNNIWTPEPTFSDRVYWPVLSKQEQDFQYFISGYYNRTSLEPYIITIILRPVLALYLQKTPLIYLEVSWGDEVLVMQVLNVSDCNEGLVCVYPYNFTDTQLYKPEEFDTEDLAFYTRDKFVTRPDCFGTFNRTSTVEFTGYWTDCSVSQPWGHPKYLVKPNCRFMRVIQYETTIYSKPITGDYYMPAFKYPMISPPIHYTRPLCK